MSWHNKINTSKENMQEIKNLLALEIDFFKECFKTCDKILKDEGIKKFDKKVFNVRFSDYLKNNFDNAKISVWQVYGNDFQFYAKNRYTKSLKSECVVYIKNDTFLFMNYNRNNYFDKETKRINLQDFFTGVENAKEELKHYIEQRKADIENLEEIAKQHNKLVDEIQEFEYKIDYTTRQYLKFDL